MKSDDSYKSINADGTPIVGSHLDGGDVIIGKVVDMKTKEKEKDKDVVGTVISKDASTTTRINEHGTVDKVIPNGKIPPYNADGHRIIKARVSLLRKPEIGDKFACFDDETQILTNSDWKLFKDLNLSDQVASMENGRLVYRHPTDLQSYHVNDQMMYTVETEHINLKVTPNHRMYVKKGSSEKFIIDEAKNLFNQRLQFKKNCEYVPPNWCGDTFRFPEESRAHDNGNEYVISMDHWLTFFGIWMTEGREDSGYITLSTNKPRVKSALVKLENDLGWHFIKCDSDENWKLSDTQICRYLKSLSKHLPQWVWQLNQNQATLLLNNMCLGDESNIQLYCTSSTKLANDFQRLTLHAGLSANIQVRSEVGTEVTTYYITVVKSDNEPQINHDLVSNKQDKWEPYTGQVYCCTVTSGIIYVRRKGIPEWLGNSRYSQKGTVGILYRSIDMPMTCTGLVPDIVMNPHGIPSRMTVGKMLETMIGKIAVACGLIQDATPFVTHNFNDYRQQLREYGLDEYGHEIMYNGQTGQMFNTKFFIGPTYYQRLKHMVEDKMHSRSSGPVQLLTRQPAEGRSRDGGLRLGEMERDALIAHGIPKFLKERMMDSSDLFRVYVSKKEESIIIGNPEQQLFKYNGQNIKDDEVMQIQLPYAMKLLLQELESMGIDIRLQVS
jgi:hypothetical protein